MPEFYFGTQVLTFYIISFTFTIHIHIYKIKCCVTEKVIQKALKQAVTHAWHCFYKKKCHHLLIQKEHSFHVVLLFWDKADTVLGCSAVFCAFCTTDLICLGVSGAHYMYPQQKLQAVLAGKLRLFSMFYPGEKYLEYTGPPVKHCPRFFLSFKRVFHIIFPV